MIEFFFLFTVLVCLPAHRDAEGHGKAVEYFDSCLSGKGKQKTRDIIRAQHGEIYQGSH